MRQGMKSTSRSFGLVVLFSALYIDYMLDPTVSLPRRAGGSRTEQEQNFKELCFDPVKVLHSHGIDHPWILSKKLNLLRSQSTHFSLNWFYIICPVVEKICA